MSAIITSLLKDKPPPFQQACFHCILQFQLISLLNRKIGFTVSLLFCVKHLLIICIHFILLIKYRSTVSKQPSPRHLNACPQRGRIKKSWVSILFHLRKKSLACPSNLSWKEKINMMGQHILSNFLLRNPS
jgi:hypothetical protein